MCGRGRLDSGVLCCCEVRIAEWYEKPVFPLPRQLLTGDQSFRTVYMPDSVEQHHVCSLICSLPLLEDLCVRRSSTGNVGGSTGIRETAPSFDPAHVDRNPQH